MVIGPLHMLRVMSIALTLFALLPGAANAGADMKKGAAHLAERHREPRPAAGHRSLLDARHDVRSSRRSTSSITFRTAGEGGAEHRGGDARDHRRRPHVDDPGATRNPVRGRPRRSRASRASSSPQDYVYSIKRSLDPNCGAAAIPRSPTSSRRAAVVDAASKPRQARLRRADRRSAGDRSLHAACASKLHAVDYTLLERLAGLTTLAVAREVVEAAGDDIMSKPVGTGPYPRSRNGCAARA